MSETCPKCGSKKWSKGSSMFVCQSHINPAGGLTVSSWCLVRQHEAEIERLRGKLQKQEVKLLEFKNECYARRTWQHLVSIPENIGKEVWFAGRRWKIEGINYLGDYDLSMTEERSDGKWRVCSSCVLGLDPEHPHYAYLIESSAPSEP